MRKYKEYADGIERTVVRADIPLTQEEYVFVAREVKKLGMTVGQYLAVECIGSLGVTIDNEEV